MAKDEAQVEAALRLVQRESRRGSDRSGAFAGSFALPDRYVTAGAEVLHYDRATAATMKGLADALTDDPRFEHLERPDAVVQEFVADCWFNESDQAGAFVTAHGRVPETLDCFVPVAHLNVKVELPVGGITLLPIGHRRVPAPTKPLAFDLTPPVGSVAVAVVTGTNLIKMAARAQTQVERVLRTMRVALRYDRGIHDDQLRFRIGRYYAFSNDAVGWQRPAGDPIDVTLSATMLNGVEIERVLSLTAVPQTDLDRKVDLALQWMERARLVDEPLPALLYLFYALEALLGDKSESLKADALAFRQLILSHAVTGHFRDPNATWFLYDRVRSAAVHGSEPPPVDTRRVQTFERSVRETLGEYLQFANSRGIVRRGQLLAALDKHPAVSELARWVVDHGGPDWAKYLAVHLAGDSNPPTGERKDDRSASRD